MSVRTHWTEAFELGVSVFAPADQIPGPFADEDGVTRDALRLVIEDIGNMEAMVIDGTVEELMEFGKNIADRAVRAAERSLR